jgi:hypothetical protein
MVVTVAGARARPAAAGANDGGRDRADHDELVEKLVGQQGAATQPPTTEFFYIDTVQRRRSQHAHTLILMNTLTQTLVGRGVEEGGLEFAVVEMYGLLLGY